MTGERWAVVVGRRDSWQMVHLVGRDGRLDFADRHLDGLRGEGLLGAGVVGGVGLRRARVLRPPVVVEAVGLLVLGGLGGRHGGRHGGRQGGRSISKRSFNLLGVLTKATSFPGL